MVDWYRNRLEQRLKGRKVLRLGSDCRDRSGSTGGAEIPGQLNLCDSADLRRATLSSEELNEHTPLRFVFRSVFGTELHTLLDSQIMCGRPESVEHGAVDT